MTVAAIPLCESCVHLRAGPDGFGFVCDAFPDGIPDKVYLDGFDHRQPLSGDHGVRWELSPEPGAADRLAAYEASRSA